MTRPAMKPMQGMALAPKILFSTAEAAHMLSLCYESLLELIRAGHLHPVRKGRRLFLHRDDLERFAREDTPLIWIPKSAGKTVRRHSEKVA